MAELSIVASPGELEVIPDLVHLFVHSVPTRSPASLAAAITGLTSYVLRQEIQDLRGRSQAIWSHLSFAASVDTVTAAAAKRCIDTHWERS